MSLLGRGLVLQPAGGVLEASGSTIEPEDGTVEMDTTSEADEADETIETSTETSTGEMSPTVAAEGLRVIATGGKKHVFEPRRRRMPKTNLKLPPKINMITTLVFKKIMPCFYIRVYVPRIISKTC